MGKLEASARHCDELREFVKQYTSLDEWLRSYRTDLTTLIHDHELLVAEPHPWKINFAVDFREIFMYVFPLSDVLRDYGAYRESASFRRTVLNHLARECLFRKTWGVGPLILLPPYQIELNHTLLKNLPSADDAAKLEDLAAQLSLALQKPMENSVSTIRAASAQPTSVSGLDYLVEFLGQHYMDLSLLLLADSSSSIARLDQILSQEVKPPTPGSILHDTVPDNEKVEFWYSRLLRRRGLTRRKQSFRHAQALAAIEHANMIAQRTSREEVCMLVTSTESVLDVVREVSQEVPQSSPTAGSEAIPVRNLGHFLVYLKSLYGFSVNDMGAPRVPEEVNPVVLENLRKAHSRASEFLSLSETSAGSLKKCPCSEASDSDGVPHEGCPLRPLEPRIEESLHELSDTREQMENTQLILKNHPDLESEYARIRAAEEPTRFDETLRSLLAHALESPGIEDAISRRVSNLVDKLILDLLGINVQVAVCLEDIDDSRMTYILDFPFYASVDSEPLKSDMEATAKEIEAAAITNDLSRLTGAFRRLVGGMLEAPPPLSEKLLVELLILLAMGDTEATVPLIERCQAMQPSSSADLEYLRIRAVIDSSQARASELCSRAIDLFPGDPRFRLLKGWLCWRESSQDLERRDVLLREAIAATDTGIEIAPCEQKASTLMCSLLNNKAYYLAQLELPDLEGAREALGQMEGLKPVDRWRSSWLDTRGYVLLRMAAAPGVSNSSKSELLAKAISSLEKALSRFMSNQTRRLATEHLGDAVHLLSMVDR